MELSLTGKIKEPLVRVFKGKDITTKIQEILPEEGQVILSGKKGKVIIYDNKSRSYREAVFDISKGQPVPTEKEFELNGYKPYNSLETVNFNRASGEAANFLEKALESFNAPVVEIGKHVGDTNNRYFSMKKYSK